MNTKIMISYLLTSFYVLTIAAQNCENCETETKKNIYNRDLSKNKLPLAYDFIHEKDVMWEKRIWQEIPVSHKRNHHFKYEKDRATLVEILLDLAITEKITLYSAMDDEFKTAISAKDAENLINQTDTFYIFDPETYEEVLTAVQIYFDAATDRKSVV